MDEPTCATTNLTPSPLPAFRFPGLEEKRAFPQWVCSPLLVMVVMAQGQACCGCILRTGIGFASYRSVEPARASLYPCHHDLCSSCEEDSAASFPLATPSELDRGVEDVR